MATAKTPMLFEGAPRIILTGLSTRPETFAFRDHIASPEVFSLAVDASAVQRIGAATPSPGQAETEVQLHSAHSARAVTTPRIQPPHPLSIQVRRTQLSRLHLGSKAWGELSCPVKNHNPLTTSTVSGHFPTSTRRGTEFRGEIPSLVMSHNPLTISTIQSHFPTSTMRGTEFRGEIPFPPPTIQDTVSCSSSGP